MSELKIGLAGQHNRPPFKNYFEPWDRTTVTVKTGRKVSPEMQTLS